MIFNSHYNIAIDATEAWQKHESPQTSNTIKKFEVWNVIYVALLPKMAPGATASLSTASRNIGMANTNI